MSKFNKLALVVATTNPKKHKELVELLAGFPIEVKSLAEFKGIHEVEEDGKTFRENAEKKALGYAKQTRCLTLAEDSGLMVDHLKGEPGVYSARFAGEGKDNLENCKKILKLMIGVPEKDRAAAFISFVSVASPEKILKTVEGKVVGRIADTMRGTEGFGYDPLFFYPGFGKTFAEVSAERKHSVSHRGQALAKIKEFLRTYLGAVSSAG